MLTIYYTIAYTDILSLIIFLFWLWDNMKKFSIMHLSGWGKGLIYLAQSIPLIIYIEYREI